MKSKSSVASWLFKPFQYIAGTKALILGLIVMLLLSVLGYLGNTHFNGVIGMQYAPPNQPQHYAVHIVYQIITLISMTVIFYIAARIVSKSSVRIIDIAGTMSLSQAPHILFGLVGLIPAVHLDFGNINAVNTNEIFSILKDNIGILVIASLLSIVILAWSIVLKYNAYSVSGNIKGVIGGISFTAALIISEILIKVLIFITIPYLH